MRNQMITNYHLATLFVIIYEHLPDDQSHVSMLIHVKNSVIVLMREIAIPILDIKVWTQFFPLKGNYLRSLTQPANTRQRTFEITEIYYDQIKYGIERI